VNTLKAVAENANKGIDFYLLVGGFLDEYYRTPTELRSALLCDRPEDTKQREYLPFLASTAHKLANDDGLTPPAWIFEERCYLRDEPFFACRAKGKLRLLFLYKSPIEFKHRNLFVDENVLVRV